MNIQKTFVLFTIGLITTFCKEHLPETLPSLNVENIKTSEGSGELIFIVSMSEANWREVSVDYITNDGSAINPEDYISSFGTLTIPAGKKSGSILISVNDDSIDEPEESFTIELDNAINAYIGDGQGVGTITDDDASPSLSIDDVSVTEGNSGTVNAAFTVKLSHKSAHTVTVDYETNDGTASSPSDYVALALNTLTFKPGVTSEVVTVLVNGDVLDEPEESFTIDLNNAMNASIEDGKGVGIIRDDDSSPAISINDVTVVEGNSGTVNAVFTVSLSHPSTQSVSVDYQTNDVTASSPSDYIAITSSTLTFAPGVISKAITVLVIGDDVDESEESFTIDLFKEVNASIGDGQGLGKIVDDDASSNLIFEETFEGPTPFSTAHSFDVGDWDYALQFVSTLAFQGNYSSRFEIRENQPLVADGKRAEVVIVKGSEGDISRNTWYSFAVYFPSDGYEFDDHNEVINQWYQDGSPATSLRTEEDGIYLHTGNEPDVDKDEIYIGPITKDEWHTLVFHFIHSYGSDGLIEIWHNGKKVTTHLGGNMYDDVLPKWKIGLYKSSFKDGSSNVERRVIYFDNIRVGDENATFDEMNPDR